MVGSPVFGIGLNDWVRPHFMHSGSMDNFWLVQAVRYGLPGFFTMAVGYAIVLWRVGRRDFDADPRLWRYRRGWMFTFVGLTFTLATVHIWTSIFSYVFFLFGAGMWMLSVQPAGGGEAAAEPEAPRPSRYARFSPGMPPPAAARGPGPLRARPQKPDRIRGAHAYAHGGDRSIRRTLRGGEEDGLALSRASHDGDREGDDDDQGDGRR